MDLRQQQIQHDASKNHSLIGKEFYVKCPDDSRYFRTVYLKRNPMTGNMQTQMSNPVYGEPPDGIPELPELMKTKLMSCSNSLPYTS